MNDKIRIDYSQLTEYGITPANAVGPTTSTTLRTVTTYDDDNCIHVRKFGIAYEIKQVTDIEDPVDTDMKFWVYALDGTLLGSRVGGGAFVAGTTLTTAQPCYLKVTGTGSATMLTTVLIDTDVDPSGKDFIFPAETIINGTSINFYLSQTTSTYYDENMIHGGARHTPDGTEALPFFTIQDALDQCDSYYPIVTVLDSETYDEELTFDGGWTLQAALGQTPKITCGIGARATREIVHDGNNTDTAYVSSSGDDSTGDGTYQKPYKTLNKVGASIGSRTHVKTMDEGPFLAETSFVIVNQMEPLYGIVTKIIGNKQVEDDFTGFMVDGNAGVGISISADNVMVHNNTVYNFTNSGINTIISARVLDIQKNIIKNSVDGVLGYGITDAYGSTGFISNNIIFDCNIGAQIVGGGGGVQISNNVIYSCGIGLDIYVGAVNWTADIKNNVIYKNSNIGINILSGAGSVTGAIKNNILWENSNYDITSEESFTMTYTIYATKNANVTAGTGCSTSDPLFMDSDNFNFALKFGSPAYKTDGFENDLGPTFGCILISATGVTINGFEIDGQEKYFYGIYKTGSTDYASLTVKWCYIHDFLGTCIDDYSGAATTGNYQNNMIGKSGSAVLVRRGCNYFNYNIVFSNIEYGLYQNYSMLEFNHNVVFNNELTGYYRASASAGPIIKNSIFNANGAYGINSIGMATVFNSCINDYVSSTVKYLPTENENITDNPIFVNENTDEEDFHLKSVARGYIFNSPCIGLADDGYDMGAYLETLSVTGGGWKTFQLTHEPSTMNIETSLKDGNVSVSNFGDMFLRGKNFKMIFPLQWSPNQATTEEQSKKIRHFQRLVPTIKNEKTRSECLFRLWFLPDTHLQSGTGVIDSTAKTITDSTKDWVEDDFTGFWIGVKHSSHASISIDSSNAQAEVTGAGWTTNEHQGRFLRINQIPFLILGNTADTLQLSDPYGYLTTETVSGSIETYYKATGNDETEITILDPYSTLPTGSYAYYLAFVRCYVSSQVYRYTQPNYAINKETWKTGYQITFEEE